MYYFIDPNAKGDERDLGTCPFETGIQKVYWMMAGVSYEEDLSRLSQITEEQADEHLAEIGWGRP